MKKRKGFMIDFEGLDCTGKTTTLRLVKEMFQKMKLETVDFKGVASDTDFGWRIKSKYSTFWFLLDLFQLTVRQIIPALQKEQLVLQDKYNFYLEAHYPDSLKGYNRFWLWLFRKYLLLEPDVIVYFDTDKDEHVRRLLRTDDFYHHRLAIGPELMDERKIMYMIAMQKFIETGRVIFVNSTHLNPTETAKVIVEDIKERLQKKNSKGEINDQHCSVHA